VIRSAWFQPYRPEGGSGHGSVTLRTHVLLPGNSLEKGRKDWGRGRKGVGNPISSKGNGVVEIAQEESRLTMKAKGGIPLEGRQERRAGGKGWGRNP